MKTLFDRSHAPAWECSPGRSSVLHGAPLERRKQHVPRWSVGTIRTSYGLVIGFTPSPLTGEGRGEGVQAFSLALLFKPAAPSPQPSPARGEGAETTR